MVGPVGRMIASRGGLVEADLDLQMPLRPDCRREASPSQLISRTGMIRVESAAFGPKMTRRVSGPASHVQRFAQTPDPPGLALPDG